MRVFLLFLTLFCSLLLQAQTNKKYELFDYPSKSFRFSLEQEEVFAFSAISIFFEEKKDTEALYLRSSPDGLMWSTWQKLKENQHTNQEKTIFGQFFIDGNHRFFELKSEQSRGLNKAVISLYSPTEFKGKKTVIAQTHNQGEAENDACPCPQPAYVNRADWGGPPTQQSGCTPAYTNVSHLIVHHEASTPQPPYAATVKSIWQFHTGSNNWCDIAYNWLIAPDGVLFEGRAGGDNVMGAHFCGNNANTMGVCLLGNYETDTPTAAALETLSKLLAWKACQGNLDPLSSSIHLGSGAFLPTIAGHRQGCPTLCPGENLFNALDSIRHKTGKFVNDPTGCDGIYPPSNDECAAAIVLTDGVPSLGTVLGASPSNVPIQQCSGFTSPTAFDVWFRFVATESTVDIQIRPDDVSSLGLDVVIALYEGDCTSLDSVRCMDHPGMPTVSLITTGGLTIGATYFIRIYDFGATQPTNGGFEIKITEQFVETDEANSLEQIRLYPNPADADFSFLTKHAPLAVMDIVVYSALGQVIFSKNKTSLSERINCSTWPKGWYHVQLRDKNGERLVLPFVKQ